MAITQAEDVIHAGVLEIRVRDGLAVAAGRVVVLSVREFDLLVALASRAGRVVRRAELYRLAWEAPMRGGDRSVDVYVRKLRVKLGRAVPEWRFIHTHVGFGYRFDPELSPHLHTVDTDR